MASFLVGWFAAFTIRALDRSIADDTLNALIAQGDRHVLTVAHCVHVAVALFDFFFDLVFDKRIEILDLFACYATLFGLRFGALNKLDLPEHLLFHDMVCGLNMCPAALHKVALIHVM
eukprot:5840922-Ditylum_brightwellii.AAC.1